MSNPYWIALHGGPGDGDHIPVVACCQTEQMVIYQSGARPGYAGRMLDNPAVYTRADGELGSHRWKGGDGVERTSATQVYRFDRCVTRSEANEIESRRWQQIDAERANGGGL